MKLLLILAAIGVHAQTVRYTDLPPAIARRFDRASFDARIEAAERDTARRERDGEFDHLIYYALQSQRFTGLARIEPALSAKQSTESGKIPADVHARLQAFLRALPHPAGDPRLRYFGTLLQPGDRTATFLEAEYRRAMRFLYEKEFQRRDHVYETRGHSTDTQVEANYAVWNGLSVLRSIDPQARIARVLIVGPGLDFAPRTALYDAVEPQSFQPYAVADALLSLGLARRSNLAIAGADVNARVLDFLRDFPTGSRRLELYTSPGDPAYERYFESLGSAIGKRTGNTLEVDSEIARVVTPRKLNILTERTGPPFDLVIATNVLVYFNSDDLALALANIAAMLKPGGYFLHNELRTELDELSAAVGLEPVQARTFLIRENLFDTFAIYRKLAK